MPTHDGSCHVCFIRLKHMHVQGMADCDTHCKAASSISLTFWPSTQKQTPSVLNLSTAAFLAFSRLARASVVDRISFSNSSVFCPHAWIISCVSLYFLRDGPMPEKQPFTGHSSSRRVFKISTTVDKFIPVG